MKIIVNSDEYRAWHEVGHATVCLHLGGDLDGIEFLERDERGFAVARGCEVAPGLERRVAYGGFAAEFFLVKNRYVDWENEQEISNIIFSNTWRDCMELIRRTVTEDNDFTTQEKEAFMNYAIQHALPIVEQHFMRMRNVVKEFLDLRKIDGERVKELLRIGVNR